MTSETKAPPPARGVVLGVIADDFTGATDVASMLVRAGLRTVQTIGVPAADLELPPADAVVVALKSRTIPAPEAVAQSLAAWRWLAAAGAVRGYFKYCSTFDSTAQGNIGPVTEALMRELGTDFTIACPAFPENGRTIFRGHLFVGDQLLSDSGMRDHPLTPMRDSNLVRVLQAQCSARVGLLRYDTVARGAAAVREAIEALRREGVRIAVADALHDEDLRTLGAAVADLPLVTAGSGVALGLPPAYVAAGLVRADAAAARLDPPAGAAAVLAGSCSTATQAQVARWIAAGRAAHRLDVAALARGGASGRDAVARAIQWARAELAAGAAAQGDRAVLVYSTADAAARAAALREAGAGDVGQAGGDAGQAGGGAGQAGGGAAATAALAVGERVEAAMAEIARGLAAAGVCRFVVAGGETSGAVVQALQVRALRIGAPICPGVPWTQASGAPLWLALKSGNFGGPDFFAEALQAAPAAA